MPFRVPMRDMLEGAAPSSRFMLLVRMPPSPVNTFFTLAHHLVYVEFTVAGASRSYSMVIIKMNSPDGP
jgi:hypothetical protein